MTGPDEPGGGRAGSHEVGEATEAATRAGYLGFEVVAERTLSDEEVAVLHERLRAWARRSAARRYGMFAGLGLGAALATAMLGSGPTYRGPSDVLLFAFAGLAVVYAVASLVAAFVMAFAAESPFVRAVVAVVVGLTVAGNLLDLPTSAVVPVFAPAILLGMFAFAVEGPLRDLACDPREAAQDLARVVRDPFTVCVASSGRRPTSRARARARRGDPGEVRRSTCS